MDNGAKKQLGKSVLWNTLGNIVYYASQYVLLILVMWMADSRHSGMLSTAMSAAAIFISVANYGMRSFQISDFEKKYTDATYLRSRWLTVGAAGIACVVFSLAISYTAEQRWIIVLYTLGRLSEGYIDVWHGFLQKADRMDLVGILFGIRGLLTMAGFGLGLLFSKNLIVTLAVLAVLSWGCALVCDIPPSRRRADFAAPRAGAVGMLLWECAPLAVFSLLNSSIGSVVKLYCERITGAEAFAWFNSVFQPVQIIQVGAMYIFAPFMMTFARLWQKRDAAGYRRAFGLTAAAMPALWALGAAAAALLGPFFLSILYPAPILDYAFLLQPAVVAAVTNIFVSVLCYLLSMMREMKGLIAANLAGIAAAFLLSAPMISSMGVAGAAWATVAARGVQALCSLAVVLWCCRKHFAAQGQQ